MKKEYSSPEAICLHLATEEIMNASNPILEGGSGTTNAPATDFGSIDLW